MLVLMLVLAGDLIWRHCHLEINRLALLAVTTTHFLSSVANENGVYYAADV